MLVLGALVAAGCDTGVVVGSTYKQINTAEFARGVSDACVDSGRGIVVCPASDMARVTRTGAVPYEHPDLDWSNGPLQLHAARNETIAFQLLLRTSETISADNVSVQLERVASNENRAGVAEQWFHQSLFTAFYHPIDNAGYDWGPATTVLPWPDEYPDALVPAKNTCGTATAIEDLLKVNLQPTPGTNQALWVDTYIDKSAEPGVYGQNIQLTVGTHKMSLPIQITVHDTSLPDKPTIDAVGELYRSYFQEGVGYDITKPEWTAMAHCYQQLAHKHRMVFIERLPQLLTPDQLESYANTISPTLTGELFTKDNGYIGPGANTPVSLWKTPWPQSIDGVTYKGITEREIQRYEGLAYLWDELVIRRGWADVDYFAYVFDEVDGPTNNGDGSLPREQYLALVHDQISRVQTAIDSGSGSTNIDLLWTSHTNPTVWENDPVLDLTNTVRLWAPNASAADTEFLRARMDAGETAWFYHSGHPSVGAHSINSSGIEMRTWGVIGARYGFQGQFMWAINLGSDDFPYRDPQYKVDENRAGNGVMVYPGNQLDKIGYEKSPGPVPSMRLKSWRRGLQDAELYFLAAENSPVAADELLKRQIPRALTEGRDSPSWSSDSADWIDFHRQLLELSSEK